MPTTILASMARVLWRLAEAHDLDADFLFRDSGLDPRQLEEPRSRYPVKRVLEAWVKAAELTDNPHIGLKAADYASPLDLHALGVAFLCSNTLLDALNRLVRYESIVNSNVGFSIVEKAEKVDFLCKGLEYEGDLLRVAEDARTSFIVDLCRTGVGGGIGPLEIAFTYPKPKNTSEHLGLFRCALQFSARTHRITFARRDVLRPFTAANRELARRNDQILDGMLQRLDEADLISKVKSAIVERLPSGTPSEEVIAKAVFTSSRTLNRRLSEAGTNFRELLTEVRRELAEQYVADPSIPITEISFLLGFSAVSSFSRAFKRWTGEPPQAFREGISH